MDPLSAAASVVALLDAACKSSKLIYSFFRDIVDGPSVVQNHCIFLQVLQGSLTQLREICAIVELQNEHAMKLRTNVNQCLKDLKIAERRIIMVDRNMKSGNMRRTWALVRWALFKGDPSIDNFFSRMKMWQSTFACDLMLLQL
jgi:Fungal N-terminal domain of STAND proteins